MYSYCFFVKYYYYVKIRAFKLEVVKFEFSGKIMYSKYDLFTINSKLIHEIYCHKKQ